MHMHSASGALDGCGIALEHEFYKHRVAIGSQPRIAHRQPSQAVVEAQLVVAFAQGITSCDTRVKSDRDGTRALDLQALFGNRYDDHHRVAPCALACDSSICRALLDNPEPTLEPHSLPLRIVWRRRYKRNRQLPLGQLFLPFPARQCKVQRRRLGPHPRRLRSYFPRGRLCRGPKCPPAQQR